MNKKLLTAAIGAALAAGPMLAQADVKLFGKVHVSVDYVDQKGANQPVNGKTTNVSSNTSRWGIDVSEKLGGGLTAIAHLETTIDATGESDTRNDTVASMNRYVGLSGGWGTVLGGIHDTPFKILSRKVELFPEQVGDLRNIVSTGGAGANASRGWDLRPSNVIAYASPNFSGFSFMLAHAADAAATNSLDDNRNQANSLSLTYAQGPLYVAYAYETHRYNSPTGLGDGEPNEKGSRLAGSYSFGAFKLTALYQDLKDLGGTIQGGSSVKRKAWSLGGAYTAGNNVFKVQYANADKLSNTATGGSTDNTGAKVWALGWDHLFSKTTKAYVAYAKADNDSASSFMMNSVGHGDAAAPAAGEDPSAWSVGMIVDF